MNQLVNETSPYLLQHKDQPVNWYPWSNEALEKAVTEDKVILLSIGYSSCHWCHVMAHECFEDLAVAKFMNDHYINIKLDREERPDIDAIYLEAVENMGLHGGWPLNVFLLPTGEPFYGGTYFPKDKWMQLLHNISQAYVTKKNDLVQSAKSLAQSLNAKESDRYYFAEDTKVTNYTNIELSKLADLITKDFDLENGGMKGSPKFPMPNFWRMVYHLSQTTHRSDLNKQVNFTLLRIGLGGIFDHLGGGWSRYSVDNRWKVPHFEKMLYDNAQLLQLYTEVAKESTYRSLFEWNVDKTIQWLKTDMEASDSGFYSAQDADSEKEEGKFYVWKKQEVLEILKEGAPLLLNTYNFTDKGNWENGKNIFHLEEIPVDWEALKPKLDLLLKTRKNRIYPGLDTKIITSWNAQLIIALLERFTENTVEVSWPKSHLDYINQNLTFKVAEGDEALGIFHQAGEKKILGFLDDYAHLILANMLMYTIDFDENYLFIAQKYCKYVLGNFWDEEEKLFFYTDFHAEKLIARKKELFDQVMPSSNSAMAKSLYFLGRYLGALEYVSIAEKMFTKIKPMTLEYPRHLSNWIDLGLLLREEPVEIAVCGQNAKEWIKTLRQKYTSRATLFFAAQEESRLEIFQSRFLNKTAIYICKNFTCDLPKFNLDFLTES